MESFWKKLQQTEKPFLVLAPMDGVTDMVFREIIAETAKPDVMFTEFTNVDALQSAGYDRTIGRLKFSEKQRPVVAQIWGNDPGNFYKTAQLVKKLGFDGIDINMGCPDRSVMKIGSGIAHIKNPPLAAQIIKATKEGAPDLPISVKTRIGINQVVTESWIAFLLEQQLDALIIHGRTAKELSRVPAHWDEIGKAVVLRDQISPHMVIVGNGDIKSRTEAVRAHEAYGVDGVMIGTGIFQNPWIFEKTPIQHTKEECLRVLLEHTKIFSEADPSPKSFPVMKKFFKIYVRAFPGADDLKKKLMETKNYEEVESIVLPYF